MFKNVENQITETQKKPYLLLRRSAVRKLRDEGYIEVVVLYGEDGGQICNEYRVAEHRS